MPAPYSDNLYSGHDNPWEDEQQHDDSSALSPADGYFHASSSGLDEAATSSQPSPARQSSSVPFVPNVMVEDPTLQEDRAAAKAREAAEESRINRAAAGGSTPFDDRQPHHHPSVAHEASFYSPAHPSRAPPPASPAAAYPQFQPHRHLGSSSASASSSSASPSGHYHRRSIDEEVSSFQPAGSMGQPANQYTVHRQTDAPPAYSPSASSPPLSSGYQTFTPPQAAAQSEAMGVPEENQNLLPRQPESMGGAPNGPQETLWRRFKRNTNTRKRVRTILGVLVILSIVIALFGGSIGVRDNDRKKPGIIDKSPVKAPPTNNPPPNMVWPPSNNCLGGPFKDSKINEVVSFGSSKKLSIIQTIEKDGRNRRGPTPNVYGEVILQPVDTSSSGQIQLEIVTNDEDLHVDVDFNKRDQQFKVTVPRWVDWREPSWRPCIQIRITVSVPREAQLESLHVETVQLNVAIKDGFVLSSVTDAQIKTVTGDVVTGRLSSGDVAPYTLASRSIIIDTVSGDVIGWFPLYDLVKIHSVSGDIKTDLTPKPSQDKKPEQAVLNVESVSGDIKLVEPLLSNKRDDEFPPRDYVVGVSSSSGDITAELAFTSKAKIETISGHQKLKLLPLFGSSSSQPILSTDTKSGETTLTLLEPLWKEPAAGYLDHMTPSKDKNSKLDNYDEPWIIIHPDQQLNKLPGQKRAPTMNASGGGDGLTRLKSHHASISGDFRLNYPVSWEGKFLLTSLSGSQDIRGDDLHFKRSGGIIKRIEGTKGDGKSDLTIDSMSGREELVFANA
ncbi:hypothetical protein M441DRAFT_138552 [Trichoderma asperellum CBS 433.97]|uniref:DUF4097 domain-containing protein n=1 Tax=Trichoderma asperellum (strain ATCC 204424 / CBS 433.97 / NBRC 101777) TaxID=1042311 RepID=A0A2T3Z8Y7_TRIA4|nr:hypothetical protein M441DRAFT_138552 [Trichoderma asperellum CBS 433.97]PTB41267.1 hypothetical protein M441DRAFT_138552 [Trichoderma asperellum CBS 433.97]